MKNSTLTLFESTTACFRLSINTMYERLKNDGTSQSSVYIHPVKETGTFRPSCFLVFTYLTSDIQTTKGIWTTVPHIYKIRQMFQTMHDIAHSEAAYITINNETNIAPEYSNPVVTDEIGKNKDWISLTLIMSSDEGSIVRRPCVAIQLSKSNSYASILTLDEFDTIYDIIMHIDFVTLEMEAVNTELLSRLLSKNTNNNTRSYTSNYQAPQPYRAPTSVTPNYGRAPAPQPAPMFKQPTVSAASAAPTTTRVATPAPATGKLPPRAAAKPEVKRPMMNPDLIESIEVEDDMIDDGDLVDEIFSD